MLQTYAFPVTTKTIENWFARLLKVLEKAEWHYNNKNYELPYDFALGNVHL
jgi:hypothetical protein